jgi:flagellar biosynthesis anti-sigma factor FlgM
MSVRVNNAPVDGRQGLQSPLDIRRAEQPQTLPQQPVKPTPAAEVSAIAAKLVAIESELVNEPYDRARVEDIKQQIRSGAYKINPDNIAGRIVDSATSYSRK